MSKLTLEGWKAEMSSYAGQFTTSAAYLEGRVRSANDAAECPLQVWTGERFDYIEEAIHYSRGLSVGDVDKIIYAADGNKLDDHEVQELRCWMLETLVA